MKVLMAGRIALSQGEPAARRWAEAHLLSLHGRRRRLLAVAGRPTLDGAPATGGIDGPAELLGVSPEALAGVGFSPGQPWAVLMGHQPGGGSGVLVALDRRTERPSLVIKFRRAGCASPAHEAGILAALTGLPSELARTLPRPLRLVSTPTHELLALSPVPGRPLSLLMQRALRPGRGLRARLESAGRWLARLHLATAQGDAVAVHGDPWPRNLLFGDAELTGAVDWEHGRLHGLPDEDLFALPLLLAADAPRWLSLRPRAGAEAFRAAFGDRGALSAAARAFLEAYRRERGVPERRLREWLERFVQASEAGTGKEEPGWRARFPWPELRASIARRGAWSG